MSRVNGGYWWWKEQINSCPRCNGEAILGTDAITGQYMVACMNCCCGNTTVFYNKSWGKAIVNWNRYTQGRKDFV
jgi:hypothetical protein